MKREFDLGPDLTVPSLGDRSVLAHCLGLIANTTWAQGWAIEFGVGEGHSLRLIADVLPVIGFDSFLGLPEDWRPGFSKGAFISQRLETGTIPGTTIVPGLFEDTLPDYDWPERIALVHFDADLYSSTITALNAMPRFEPGTILVFDEFHGYDDDFEGEMPGEQQAWWEYVAVYPYEWDVIGHGREQWAIRITKVLDR